MSCPGSTVPCYLGRCRRRPRGIEGAPLASRNQGRGRCRRRLAGPRGLRQQHRQHTSPGGTGGSTGGTGGGTLKIGMAYDVGGRGDQSFNDAAAAGLDKAKAELGADFKEASAVNGEAESARKERLQQLIDAGYNPHHRGRLRLRQGRRRDRQGQPRRQVRHRRRRVARLGRPQRRPDHLRRGAGLLPRRRGRGPQDQDQPRRLHRWRPDRPHQEVRGGLRGRRQGGQAGRQDRRHSTSRSRRTSPASTRHKGKAAAEGMYQGGADVVYHAAGGSGGGVFTAAKAAGKMAIGVDSDQAKTAPADVRDVIITSMIKKVDVGGVRLHHLGEETTTSRPATRSSTSRPAASTTPRPVATSTTSRASSTSTSRRSSRARSRSRSPDHPDPGRDGLRGRPTGRPGRREQRRPGRGIFPTSPTRHRGLLGSRVLVQYSIDARVEAGPHEECVSSSATRP